MTKKSRDMTKPNSLIYCETIIISSIWSDELWDMDVSILIINHIFHYTIKLIYVESFFLIYEYILAKDIIIDLIEWNVNHNLLRSKNNKSFIDHSRPSYDSWHAQMMPYYWPLAEQHPISSKYDCLHISHYDDLKSRDQFHYRTLEINHWYSDSYLCKLSQVGSNVLFNYRTFMCPLKCHYTLTFESNHLLTSKKCHMW